VGALRDCNGKPHLHIGEVGSLTSYPGHELTCGRFIVSPKTFREFNGDSLCGHIPRPVKLNGEFWVISEDSLLQNRRVFRSSQRTLIKVGSLSSHPSIFVKTGSFGSYPGAFRKELAVYGHTKDLYQRKEMDGLMSHPGPLKGVGQFCVMSGTVQMASGSLWSYQGPERCSRQFSVIPRTEVLYGTICEGYLKPHGPRRMCRCTTITTLPTHSPRRPLQ
jgi:hypothetical protein